MRFELRENLRLRVYLMPARLTVYSEGRRMPREPRDGGEITIVETKMKAVFVFEMD
jgi:hypothetical protein